MIFSSSLQVRSTALTFVMAWVVPLSLQAQLTYLDAVDGSNGNTTLSNGAVLDATDTTGATTWRQRDNVDAEHAALHFAVLDDLVHDGLDHVRRDREAEIVRPDEHARGASIAGAGPTPVDQSLALNCTP